MPSCLGCPGSSPPPPLCTPLPLTHLQHKRLNKTKRALDLPANKEHFRLQLQHYTFLQNNIDASLLRAKIYQVHDFALQRCGKMHSGMTRTISHYSLHCTNLATEWAAWTSSSSTNLFRVRSSLDLGRARAELPCRSCAPEITTAFKVRQRFWFAVIRRKPISATALRMWRKTLLEEILRHTDRGIRLLPIGPRYFDEIL